ncbi:MAG TPA: tetratricopeptide repeat protein [Vicinamibacterales bacterium]
MSIVIRRAVAIAVGLVAALTAVEILIRITGRRVEPSLGTILALTRTAQENTQRTGGPAIFKLWESDEVLGWRFRADTSVDLGSIRYYERKIARTNRDGMLDADPDPRKKFVFVIGDSLVEGLPVADEQHFARRLERVFPSHDFLNFGVSGYGTVQSYLHLQQRMKERTPTHVIFAVYFGNDFDDNDPFRNNSMVALAGYRRDAIPFLTAADDIAYGAAARPMVAGLLERSQVWLVAQRAARSAGLIRPYGYGVTLRILRKLDAELRSVNVPMTVLLIPDDPMLTSPAAPLHDALMADLAASSIDTISLLPAFRSTGLQTMGFRDQSGTTIDPHWTSAGHAVAARAIAEAMRSRLPGGAEDLSRLDEEETQAATMKAGLDALYTRGDAAAAVVEFRKVLAINPTHYGATYQLATALDRSGRPNEARPLWESVVKMAEQYKDLQTLATARNRLARKP